MILDDKLLFVDTYAKINSVMKDYKDKKVCVAYSGGSDSDTILWLFRWLGYDVPAVFFDTGLEYQATWDQLKYMRLNNFNIDVKKANMPIPTSNKKYGNPFLSKYVSEMIYRMQKHSFKFSSDGNKSLDELCELYPKMRAASRWWTNSFNYKSMNISWNRCLKEFLIKNNGLPFKVSNKCCDGAKKNPAEEYIKENKIDLMILGIRKSEGGVREMKYKSCFISSNKHSYSKFFPIFWWKKEDKFLFDQTSKIQHSKCYSEYGLDRTGCAGCPFGKNFEKELIAIDNFEPKLSKGIKNIFSESYKWTRKYREFKEEYK